MEIFRGVRILWGLIPSIIYREPIYPSLVVVVVVRTRYIMKPHTRTDVRVYSTVQYVHVLFFRDS
jgi:hypothetical protein